VRTMRWRVLTLEPKVSLRAKWPSMSGLIEYNFRRPHQASGYLPPINFTFKYHKVLPMYPSSTVS
jgi:hypothetical protein